MLFDALYRPGNIFLKKASYPSTHGPIVDIWLQGCIYGDMLLPRPMVLGFFNGRCDAA